MTYELQNISTAIFVNITIAILIRQEYVANSIFTIICLAPLSTPFGIRKRLARVYHLGGLHSGCATAACIWLILFTVVITITVTQALLAVAVISYILVLLLLAMIISSHPYHREAHYDRFELIHRFAGSVVISLLWLQVILLADALRGKNSLGLALISTPAFWLLSISTISIVLPWLRLRKVVIRSKVLSDHALLISFDHTSPVPGTFIRIVKNPFSDWHSFATISKPDEQGFSILVSNAGDWTSHQIRNHTASIWVRGIHTCGVIRTTALSKSVVLVATGSGIGPCLPLLYAKKVRVHVIWSAPHPETTYGKDFITDILAADSRAVIHDSRKLGRPNLIELTCSVFEETQAEAVFVVSNKTVTEGLVQALESRAIPVFSPVFDS